MQWIELQGTEQERQQQHRDWFQECCQRKVDCVIVAQGKIVIEVDVRHPLSATAGRELESWMRVNQLQGFVHPGYVHVRIGSKPATPWMEEIGEILRKDRAPARLGEGMATVLDRTGLWPEMRGEEEVYIREIPGRPGRCIAIRHLCETVVDVPMKQFRLEP